MNSFLLFPIKINSPYHHSVFEDRVNCPRQECSEYESTWKQQTNQTSATHLNTMLLLSPNSEFRENWRERRGNTAPQRKGLSYPKTGLDRLSMGPAETLRHPLNPKCPPRIGPAD